MANHLKIESRRRGYSMQGERASGSAPVNYSKRTRRMLLLGLGAFTAAVVLAVGGCSKKAPSLSLLVWEGYADPSFIQGFEATCQCKVVAAYMGSSDELMAKLRGGAASNYDVISPSINSMCLPAKRGSRASASRCADVKR